MDVPNLSRESEWLQYVAAHAQANTAAAFTDLSALERQIVRLRIRLWFIRLIAGVATVLGFIGMILSAFGIAAYLESSADTTRSASPMVWGFAALGLTVAGLQGINIYSWYRKHRLKNLSARHKYDILGSDAFCALIAAAEQGAVEIAEVLPSSSLGKMSPISQLPVRVLGKRDWDDPFLPSRFQIIEPNDLFRKFANSGRSRFLVLTPFELNARGDSGDPVPKTVGGEILWYLYSLWNLTATELEALFDDAPIYPKDDVMKLRAKVAGLAFRERVDGLRALQALDERCEPFSEMEMTRIKEKTFAVRHAKSRLKEYEPKAEAEGGLSYLDAANFARRNQVESVKKAPSWLKNLATGNYTPVTPHLEHLAMERGLIHARYLSK